jgi:signal recognition particle receptor subunit beta
VAYEHSERRQAASTNFVISGGFGAGKTTFVGAVSVITVDARDRNAAKSALIAITEYALTSLTAAPR